MESGLLPMKSPLQADDTPLPIASYAGSASVPQGSPSQLYKKEVTVPYPETTMVNAELMVFLCFA